MAKLMTTDEAAAYLRMRPQTLRGWRCHGSWPAYHRLGNRSLYDQADLDEWLKKTRIEQPKIQRTAWPKKIVV